MIQNDRTIPSIGLQDKSDSQFMRLAIGEARRAQLMGEVPVGAVVVKDGKVIATGCNSPRSDSDPTAHAEISALRNAALVLGNYRLEGCTLYVTLEPCSMCAGAILHARLDRVVFGAMDPKTGAAGSVVDLFSNKQLNHHTQVCGHVLAGDCAKQLKEFFQRRRQSEKAVAQPVRDDSLRTPAARFDDLPGYPWQGQYTQSLRSLGGLRMHYLDEGERSAKTVFLCLHGNPAWSYLYRKMIPVWIQAGCRVIAPDLIGFGKSDKPKREGVHTFEFHRKYLLELVEYLDLTGIVLVVQDWGGILGLTMPMEAPLRYQGLVVMNTMLGTGDVPLSAGFLSWREMCRTRPDFEVGRLIARGNPNLTEAECAAYDAPFPSSGYRAALRAFPKMVPDSPDADGAAVSLRAQEFLQKKWIGKTIFAVGMRDPVWGSTPMARLHGHIRNAPEPLQLLNAGHFVQEQGEALASVAASTFAGR